MQNVILSIHIIACIVMTVVIMLQKSEGGALGIGGGGGGLMTGRSAAGALVRVTMLFGGIFFMTSLGLTTLANRTADTRSTVERVIDAENPNASTGPTDLLDPNAPLLATPEPDSSAIAPPLDTVTDAPIAPALPEAGADTATDAEPETPETEDNPN